MKARHSLFGAVLLLCVELFVAAGISNAQNVPQLDGVKNFRDIGGYTTTDGSRVRYGILYRSADLVTMTPEDRERLRAKDLRREIDLRSPTEMTTRPSNWGSNAPAVETPFHSLYEPNALKTASVSVSVGYADLAMFQAESIGEIIRGLSHDEGASLVHCAVGNDRTGVTVAVLMTVLGVPRDQVVHEYLRSNEYWTSDEGRKELKQRTNSSDEVIRAWPGLTAANLNGMFDIIDQRYTSFDGYIRNGLKLSQADVDAARARFLEKPSSR